MGTKWNNMLDSVCEFVVKRKVLLIGYGLIIVGISSFVVFIDVFYSLFSFKRYVLIVVCALCLAGGISLILQYFADKIKTEECTSEDYYVDWKNEKKQMQKKMLFWSIMLVIVAMISGDLFVPMAESAPLVVALTIILSLHLTIEKIMAKKLERWVESMTDINQRKVQEALEIERVSLEKISRSDQLRIDLITNVSHDLKTPVTSMVGYIELMKKEELSDVMKDYVEVLEDKTDKLKEMINSLFSLAKASSGNVELRMEKFEVNRLMEQIMADMKDKIDESELKFITQLTKEDTTIVSDNMYFYRICQNLIENALKYSLKGSRVFVKTFMRDNAKLCLEITNTAGYEMDFDKEDILERFTRGDKARTTEGNGLGLAIVSTYAKTLGGEFDVKIDCDQFKTYLEFPKGKVLV